MIDSECIYRSWAKIFPMLKVKNTDITYHKLHFLEIRKNSA
jgi:hypothetical protein